MIQTPIGIEAAYQIDDDQTATEAVLEAVADQVDIDVLDLAIPLYDAIDPDALESFYEAAKDSFGTDTTSVSFTYYGYNVQVTGTGDVVLTK